MSKYTLTYRKGRSQEIYIEEIGNDKKEPLYFKQEYDDAIRLIKEIIILQGIGADDDKEDDNKNGKNENGKKNKRDIKKYGCNNRVLFAGQRGCGKTSVMQSLAEYLSKYKIKIEKNDDEEDDEKIKCYCLPMVDPSHFDNNNNILLTVITSMFSEAKKKMETNSDKDESAEREDLLKQFEKVFKSLDSIKSELSSYTLESLNRKSDAEDLRDKMNTLVSKFLKYVVGNKEARLILLIDDIDMSVSYASEMLEQLRKYLELDNLIILMSANLGQLSNEMREKYSSAFQYTLKDSNQALSIDVEDLATKYLLKLFPTSRRINVERHTSQLLDTKLIIKESSNEVAKNDIEGDFQKVILSLIWNKTRLLFIPKDPVNTLHPIIPKNLRDLAQFLDMLTALQNVGSVYEYKKNEKDKETIKESRLFAYKNDYDTCEHNLQVFKNYFMKTWIPNHLIVGEELVFHNIPTDITEINKHLINSINIIGTNHKDDLMSRQVGLDIIEKNADNVFIDRDIYTMVSPNDPKFVKANKISDIFNQPSNYSYGDLLLMIDKYETYFESEEHRKFTDAIKIYYSILLFETMFFRSNEVEYNLDDFKKKTDSGKDTVIPIQKLIGGNVYYPNYFEIITDKNFNQKGPSYDAKRAFYHKVNVDGKKVGEGYPLFAVLYYGDIRPDRYEKDHIYDTTFEKNANVEGVEYVTFDILSILNNMLNPCHTLSRIDEEHRDLNKWKGFVDGISDWGERNKIDNASIPNAILPFYSVDMMLEYLRKDYRVSEICTPPDTKNAKKLADDYYFLFKLEQCEEDSIAMEQKSMCEKEKIIFDKIKNDLVKELNNYLVDTLKLTELNCVNFDETLAKAFFPENVRKKEELIKRIIEESMRLMVSKETEATILKKIEDNNDILIDQNTKVEIKTAISTLFNTIRSLSDSIKIIKRGKSPLIKEELDKIKEGINSSSHVDSNQLIQFVISQEKKDKIIMHIESGRVDMINALPITDDVKNELITKVKEHATNQFMEILNKNSISDEEFSQIDFILKQYNCNKATINLLSKTKQTIFSDENQVRTFAHYLRVICKAYVCYYLITNSCNDICGDNKDSITDLYKNRIIALVMGLNKMFMSKKEKETLVKEIHKYETVSEVYSHLVDVLWRNSITELCIRGVIQEKVRSIDTVQEYYGKLWDRTKTMLSSIDHSGTNTLVSVYEEVFYDAEKIFIQ